MVSTAIASPLEIWSVGMETILRDCGLDVIGLCSIEPSDVFASIPPVDLLILAWGYVSHNPSAEYSRPLDGQFAGKIVLVLEPEDEFTTADFIATDVEGLILSSASIQDVTDCIGSVCRGSRWVDPGVRILLGHAPHPSSQWHELSGREHEVARLAATGLCNKKIARSLNLSDGTVKAHIHHILGKLRMSSRLELMQSFHEQRIGRPPADEKSPWERQRHPRILQLVADNRARPASDVDRQ